FFSYHSSYSDWKVSLTNVLTLVREEFDDMVAGAVIDFSIITPYNLDTCVVPTDPLPELINTDDMKIAYDIECIATGLEGLSLSIPEVVGKKILLVVTGNNINHPVSSSPDSSQYAWNNTLLGIGAVTIPNERFLIL